MDETQTKLFQAWEGRDRRRYDSQIDNLLEKLEVHFKEESDYRREFGERFVAIESDLSSVSTSMKKLADVLERLTIIEERDRMHNKSLSEINENLKSLTKQVNDDKDKVEEKIRLIDNRVNRWVYAGSGVTATLVVIWTLIGSNIATKISDIEKISEEVKIHLATDKPTGWPIVPSVSQDKRN